jgi:hypothetical protein
MGERSSVGNGRRLENGMQSSGENRAQIFARVNMSYGHKVKSDHQQCVGEITEFHYCSLKADSNLVHSAGHQKLILSHSLPL